MVTRVPPSVVPDEGRIALIVGVLEPLLPNVKQLGSETETGCGWFVPMIRVTAAGSVGAAKSENPGTRTVTELAPTVWTTPSRVTPLTVKVTRVVAGVPKKRPPFRVSVEPPSFAAKLGLHDDTKGSVPESGWKTTARFAEPFWPWTVAAAWTLDEPAPGPHNAVTAVPFCVTTETSGSPLCENVPKSVLKETPVPSGTGLPLSETTA